MMTLFSLSIILTMYQASQVSTAVTVATLRLGDEETEDQTSRAAGKLVLERAEGGEL